MRLQPASDLQGQQDLNPTGDMECFRMQGICVPPTFYFDQDRISFGVVSSGFLTTKTVTITNTSEVFRQREGVECPANLDIV